MPDTRRRQDLREARIGKVDFAGCDVCAPTDPGIRIVFHNKQGGSFRLCRNCLHFAVKKYGKAG